MVVTIRYSRVNPVSEANTLSTLADVFGTGHLRHRCLGERVTGCSNVLVVPNPEVEGAPQILTDGQIWVCNACGAKHEYYIAYRGAERYGMIRLLEGVDDRGRGEPTVTEFLEKP